jgi:hypothetical protein
MRCLKQTFHLPRSDYERSSVYRSCCRPCDRKRIRGAAFSLHPSLRVSLLLSSDAHERHGRKRGLCDSYATSECVASSLSSHSIAFHCPQSAEPRFVCRAIFQTSSPPLGELPASNCNPSTFSSSVSSFSHHHWRPLCFVVSAPTHWQSLPLKSAVAVSEQVLQVSPL